MTDPQVRRKEYLSQNLCHLLPTVKFPWSLILTHKFGLTDSSLGTTQSVKGTLESVRHIKKPGTKRVNILPLLLSNIEYRNDTPKLFNCKHKSCRDLFIV